MQKNQLILGEKKTEIIKNSSDTNNAFLADEKNYDK